MKKIFAGLIVCMIATTGVANVAFASNVAVEVNQATTVNTVSKAVEIAKKQVNGIVTSVEDNYASYEIEIRSGNTKYEYYVNKADGTIYEKEREVKHSYKMGKAPKYDIVAALNLANKSAGNAVFKEIEYKGGYYKAEYIDGYMEYNIYVDGNTGAVNKTEEYDD